MRGIPSPNCFHDNDFSGVSSNISCFTITTKLSKQREMSALKLNTCDKLDLYEQSTLNDRKFGLGGDSHADLLLNEEPIAGDLQLGLFQ